MHSTIPWPNHDYLIQDALISLTYIGRTPFYISTFTWYEVSYLYHSMESVISNSYLHGSYLHPFHDQCGGPLQEIAEFAHGLVALSPSLQGCWSHPISISNIFIRVHIIVALSTNANIKTMIIISGSLYIYIFQYSYQSYNILCMQYISPCSSSINLGNVVIISKTEF